MVHSADWTKPQGGISMTGESLDNPAYPSHGMSVAKT